MLRITGCTYCLLYIVYCVLHNAYCQREPWTLERSALPDDKPVGGIVGVAGWLAAGVPSTQRTAQHSPAQHSTTPTPAPSGRTLLLACCMGARPPQMTHFNCVLMFETVVIILNKAKQHKPTYPSQDKYLCNACRSKIKWCHLQG